MELKFGKRTGNSSENLRNSLLSMKNKERIKTFKSFGVITYFSVKYYVYLFK
jgi:hypothetical protein